MLQRVFTADLDPAGCGARPGASQRCGRHAGTATGAGPGYMFLEICC